MEDSESLEDSFHEKMVPYDSFALDPWGVLNDQRLMVKFESQLYRWRDACPLLLSLLLYNRPFQDVIEEGSGSFDRTAYLPPNILNNSSF